MKKKILALMVCLSLILGLAGCNVYPNPPERGSDTTTESMAVSDTTAESMEVSDTAESEAPEVTEPEVTEPRGPIVQAEASKWSVIAEEEYTFSSNLIGYYDENSALSIGFGGEIHYMNAEEKDWPNAENNSLCRFGMDIIDGTIGYTCGNGGHVTKSTDGGKTFTRVTDFGYSQPDQCSMMSFCDENNGLIASMERLAITYDGAETWKELTVPSEMVAIRMETPEKFCYIGRDFNLYKTADGGTTWENTPMNLPLGDGYLAAPRIFTLCIDGDNMYSVFCIEKETKTVKSYSTADGWNSCTENIIPEISGFKQAVLYLSQDGTIMTVTDFSAKKVIAIKKQ